MANLLEKLISYTFTTKDKFIIFETLKIDSYNTYSYIFYSPVKELILRNPLHIKKFFEDIEKYLKKGFYLAGFLSYELGYFLDYKLDERNLKYKIKGFSFPLAFFYVFKDPIIYDHRSEKFFNIDKELLLKIEKFVNSNNHYKLKGVKLNLSEEEYIKDINKIKQYILNGDTYQINYTIKTKFKINGSIAGFYNKVKNFQKVSYSAAIKTKDFYILSFSPELFFRKDKNILIVKPMKGTILRGKNLLEDRINAKILKNSIKNRAENVMIVDLLRNDLGKISHYGAVKVEKLFEIEKYETLFQMTSTIKTVLLEDINLYTLFKAIFPSGSVTGAPKIRSMQIIQELEKEQRKIYTGCIGFLTPEKNAVFNVAIRTVLIEKNRNAEMGIGSGIVADSDPKKEFEECKLKANFLFKTQPEFRLLETILFSNFPVKLKKFDSIYLNIDESNFKNGFFLLDLHLKRLKESAYYFDFKYDEELILEVLKKLKRKILYENFYKVRLLLSKNGKVELQPQPLMGFKFCCESPVKIKLSKVSINPEEVFLYHKTTHRIIYNKEYNNYKRYGYFDVLFTNNERQITETSRGNIFLKIDGKIFTPKLKSGLLKGVFRSLIMKYNDVIETFLTVEDLFKAQKIYITNSVIGIREAEIKL
ncbi:MAG: aminodeoxychorismate synthase component I [Endomicrobiia bacterium]